MALEEGEVRGKGKEKRKKAGFGDTLGPTLVALHLRSLFLCRFATVNDKTRIRNNVMQLPITFLSVC